MSYINVENLSVGYGDNLIIENMDLSILEGKITVIIGPNGCGKSTLLKTMGRLLSPKGGAVYLNEKNIIEYATKDIAKQMAILPQSPNAPAGLTVGELVAHGRYPHRHGFGKLSKHDIECINWALEVTKLAELENKDIDALSGGQRQRAWIAMAIAQKTNSILLDEPTTYLDMSYQLEVLQLLAKLNKKEKYTIVMVLHDLNLAARHADNIVALKAGKIVASGNVVDIMKTEVLKEVFNIDAQIVFDERTKTPSCLSYELLG